MMDDIIHSTKQTITERLSSPLIGSFVVAWCLINYKFLVILFSENNITKTFQLIEQISFPNAQTIFLKGFLLPLMIAVVYVFLYPYPARYIYTFTLKRQKETNKIRQEIEGSVLLTVEESRKLKNEFYKKETEHQKQIDNLNAKISDLSLEIDEFQKKTSQAENITSTKISSISLEPSQMEIMDLIYKSNGEILEVDLIGSLKGSKVKNDYDIDLLTQKDLIRKPFTHYRKSQTYEFTQAGRDFYIKKINSSIK